MVGETAFTFICADSTLCGILHEPAEISSDKAMLIVVGGPQYRVGSHRQFVLLARHLAAQGIPVMRFDYRGIGDSGGEPRNFECIDEDIDCAIVALQTRLPQAKRIYIWGLCDAASAAAFYVKNNPRAAVAGLILLNPWIRTETGLAKSYLKSYYAGRIINPMFWRKLFTGKLSLFQSLISLFANMRSALFGSRQQSNLTPEPGQTSVAKSLPERVLDGIANFDGPILLILSGNDLTASEFKDAISGPRRWRRLMQRSSLVRKDLCDANHTFSSREWRDEVAGMTFQWISSH